MTRTLVDSHDKLLRDYKKLRAENEKLQRINKGLSRFIGMIEEHLNRPPHILTSNDYERLDEVFTKQERAGLHPPIPVSPFKHSDPLHKEEQ